MLLQQPQQKYLNKINIIDFNKKVVNLNLFLHKKMLKQHQQGMG